MAKRQHHCFALLLLLNVYSSAVRATEVDPIWRSADISKMVCDQEKEYKERNTMPPAVQAKSTDKYCGWFRKANNGDACSDGMVTFWECPEEARGRSAKGRKSTRIVGGHNARMYKFPSILLLKLDGYHICGAAIYNEEWVVTAAHCMITDKPSRFSFVAGEYNKGVQEGPEQEVTATKIVVHKKYNSNNFRNDIALLKVSPKFKMNDKVAPSNLPDPNYTPNGTGTVIGWGATTEGGSTAQILQEVEVPLLTTEKCKQLYQASSITDNMLCAGYEQGTKDSCQGDSGGPFFVCQGNKLVQVGVVSWGEGCARAKKPGVYTKISKYLDWIRKHAQG